MTPSKQTQQYLLQFMESTSLVSAITSGMATVVQLLQATGPIYWPRVVIAFVVTVLLVVLHSIIAHLNDPALQTMSNALVDALAKRAQPYTGVAPMIQNPGPLVVVHNVPAPTQPSPMAGYPPLNGTVSVPNYYTSTSAPPITLTPTPTPLSEDTASRPVVKPPQ